MVLHYFSRSYFIHVPFQFTVWIIIRIGWDIVSSHGSILLRGLTCLGLASGQNCKSTPYEHLCTKGNTDFHLT